jgi:molybdate transport system regulatory protein
MGDAPVLKIKLQIMRGDEIAMGPGKADLLDAIAAHGSISAGARAIGMSYRRAWLLVDTMNRCWQAPLVETAPGGKARSGAQVTALGREVLAQYRALQAAADGLRGGEWERLRGLLAGASRNESG